MNEMVKRKWTAMDGSLVFDVNINREPGEGIPSIASVSWRSGQSDSQLVTITKLWPGKPFEFRFRTGCYVSGYLQQKTPVHIDGVTHTAIFGDIRYGMTGQSDDHHFRGHHGGLPHARPCARTLAACPTSHSTRPWLASSPSSIAKPGTCHDQPGSLQYCQQRAAGQRLAAPV